MLPKAQILRYQAEILCVYSTVNSLQLIKQPKGNCAYLHPTFMVRVMLDSLSEKKQFLTRKMVIFQYLAGNFLLPTYITTGGTVAATVMGGSPGLGLAAKHSTPVEEKTSSQ